MARSPRPEPDLGNPEETPFLRFDLGEVMYPPNTIYRDAAVLLRQLDEGKRSSLVLDQLIRKGPVGGQDGVLRESTWFDLFQRFLIYRSDATKDKAAAERHSIDALKLMCRRPHEDAWSLLREFITTRVDELSGWSDSLYFHADGSDVSEEGNVYNSDQSYQPIRILGAEERRIDFITTQLVSETGLLHQFIAMFSVFAIADDFERNPRDYHRWIKAMIPGPRSHSVIVTWDFMYFKYSRSYIWRPRSPFCDPKWLGGDILGLLADTLETDHRLNSHPMDVDQEWLQDGYKFQVDYALETKLQLGRNACIYIPFEGKTLRWINATPEADGTVSVSISDRKDHRAEDEMVLRFLSLLAWENSLPARIKFSVSGGRTAYSKAYSPRGGTLGLRIDPLFWPRSFNRSLDKSQRVALALYREAMNSSSTFYEFLSYYKILELALPGGAQVRGKWLDAKAIPKLGYVPRMKEILAQHPNLENYLRKVKVNGIKHAINMTIDPDSPEDQLATTKDNRLMEQIARLVMNDKLGL
jgi:hypothetical protein